MLVPSITIKEAKKAIALLDSLVPFQRSRRPEESEHYYGFAVPD